MTLIKVLLGITAGFILLIILIAGGALLFVHFYADEKFDREWDQTKLEGADFGKHTEQSGCLSEGLKRSKKVNLGSSFKDKAMLGVFVRGCLPESRPTNEFCARVPADYDLLHVEDWKTEQCDKAGLSEISSGCSFVFEQQINFCSRNVD